MADCLKPQRNATRKTAAYLEPLFLLSLRLLALCLALNAAEALQAGFVGFSIFSSGGRTTQFDSNFQVSGTLTGLASFGGTLRDTAFIDGTLYGVVTGPGGAYGSGIYRLVTDPSVVQIYGTNVWAPVATSTGPTGSASLAFLNNATEARFQLQFDEDAAPATTPEPSALVLLGSGLFGLMINKSRRRRCEPSST